jgi:hypothetical protein
MKAVLIAALLLPPGAAGIWSGTTNSGFIDMQEGGEFYYSTEKSGMNEFDCQMMTKTPEKYGYSVDCTDRKTGKLVRGQMQFYEDGTMGFDETRFTYGDCPRGCPE